MFQRVCVCVGVCVVNLFTYGRVGKEGFCNVNTPV